MRFLFRRVRSPIVFLRLGAYVLATIAAFRCRPHAQNDRRNRLARLARPENSRMAAAPAALCRHAGACGRLCRARSRRGARFGRALVAAGGANLLPANQRGGLRGDPCDRRRAKRRRFTAACRAHRRHAPAAGLCGGRRSATIVCSADDKTAQAEGRRLMERLVPQMKFCQPL